MRSILRAETVYSEDGVIEGGCIEVVDGEIRRIGRSDDLAFRGAEVLQFANASLLPGMIDIHIHGWKSIDVTDDALDEIALLPRDLAREGVTAFLPTLISCSEETILRQAEIVRKLRAGGCGGAEILGLHLEGPWLSFERRGAHPAQWVRSPQEAEVRRILDQTRDIVRAVTLSPEVPGAEWLARTLAREGILPIIGHSNASYEQTMRVIDAGARHVTHMFNAMLGFRENATELGTVEPGIETAVYLRDEVTAEVIPSPAFVSPALLRLLWRIKGAQRIALVTDAGRGAGYAEGYGMEFADGRRAVVGPDALRLVEEGPLNNALLGNVDPLPRGLQGFARNIGIPIEEALPTVCSTPARILGMQGSRGALAKGKRADIIAVDDAMRVLMTMVAGVVQFSAA